MISSTIKMADDIVERLATEMNECWQAHLDRDDRTSPEEYPEMALITQDEFFGYMRIAAALNDDLIDRQRGTIAALIRLARATLDAADNSEDCDLFHKVEHDDFIKISAALDALDELPEDPDCVMTGPAKAEWTLRRIYDPAQQLSAPSKALIDRQREEIGRLRSLLERALPSVKADAEMMDAMDRHAPLPDADMPSVTAAANNLDALLGSIRTALSGTTRKKTDG